MTGRKYEEVIEIRIDNGEKIIPDSLNFTISIISDWFAHTPFYQNSGLILNFYKNLDENEDYKHRNDIIEDSGEKNLFFSKNDKVYTCLRCGKESEVCGFCQKCYNIIYTLDKKETVRVKLSDIKCNEKFLCLVEKDKGYTSQIKESMLLYGMKNPIIIDTDHRILIGHHRYYIAKELGWEYIDAIYNEIQFNYEMFYEGKGWNLSVGRIDGNLVTSTTDMGMIITLLRDFVANSMGNTLTLECFVNVGSDIRLRKVFIPERGHIVDPTWKEWWVNKYGKEPR